MPSDSLHFHYVWDIDRELDSIPWWWQVADRCPRGGMEIERRR